MTYFNFLLKKYIKIPYFIGKLSIACTIRKDGIEHAGYLAFLTFLSLFPFLIFLVSITSYFGSSIPELESFMGILKHIPDNIYQSLEPRIAEIVTGPPQSLLTVAVIGIIWSASSTVEGMRTILNRAYRISSPPPYIWRRLLSILQFLIIAALILLTTLVLVFVPAILKKVELGLGVNFNIDYDLFHARSFIIFFMLVVSISAIYYYIPNTDQKWNNTLPGAFVCLGLWWVILKLFYIYLEKFNQFNLVYGSLAGIIGTLVFFYLVNLGLIVGAEFNYHFKRAYCNKKSLFR